MVIGWVFPHWGRPEGRQRPLQPSRMHGHPQDAHRRQAAPNPRSGPRDRPSADRHGRPAGLTPGPSRTALTKARQHNGSGLELPKGRAPKRLRADEIRAGRPDGGQTTASMFPASSGKKGIISFGSIYGEKPWGGCRWVVVLGEIAWGLVASWPCSFLWRSRPCSASMRSSEPSGGLEKISLSVINMDL